MSQDREPGWYLDAQLADLIAYCRAVTGREEDAVGTAHAARDAALNLLTDPDQLRAWLFALARMEILAGSEPDAGEVFDLVHRLGIRPEDLPVVLRIAPGEAEQVLAAAEEE